ncbi:MULTISPECIES: hypothetical protein [Streptomyces]|uniref:hypothetical protein n=1 Tax=Streptomyces TaxID=1883 RepID=UPI0015D51621|nr:hypothetical protein [Streptomyces sp. ScaeMP-e48]WST13420.1 hypothetical protein OG721_05295 [Streptomyces microflavus]
MTTRPQLPGDPSDLHLRISYDDELGDTPQPTRWSDGTWPFFTASACTTQARER